MYQDRLAVAIKTNGKVLREGKSAGSDRDDTVFIPFGSEYSIYVKNMNSVRALVRIEIDGESVTDGMSLIVEANDDIEIERFVKNRNMDTGLRLKFIERTQKIEDGPSTSSNVSQRRSSHRRSTSRRTGRQLARSITTITTLVTFGTRSSALPAPLLTNWLVDTAAPATTLLPMAPCTPKLR